MQSLLHIPCTSPRGEIVKQNIPPVREKIEEKNISIEEQYKKKLQELVTKYTNIDSFKLPEKQEPSVSASTTEKPKEEKKEEKSYSKRYVGTDTMKVFQRASWQSPAEITLSRGDEVEFTGKKETVGNITWAQVKVGDKTGWVFANYLKKDKEQTVPIDSLPPYKQPRKRGDALPVKHQTQQNVSDFACVIACDAIIFNYFGANVSVAELRDVNGDDNAKHYLLMDYAGLNGKIIYKDMWENKDSKIFKEAEKKDIEPQVFEKCREALQQGIPIMVEIQYYREGVRGTHSVVVYGMKGEGTKASDFLALDPWKEEGDKANYTNTLADSENMFRNDTPKINNWRIYYPIE